MASSKPPADKRYGLFSLQESDRPALLKHLLSLDADARRLRFGVLLSDEAIARIAQQLPLADQSLGLFVWGELKGCAHLIKIDHELAELALSLSPDMRGRGWGRILFDELIERASCKRLKTVEIQYLLENRPMHRLASRLPGPCHHECSEARKLAVVA